MHPLDFEEFLWAMGCGKNVVDSMKQLFKRKEALSEPLHNYVLQQFKIYLLVGGMPDAINKFVGNRNIAQVRTIQQDIIALYKMDASQYGDSKKLVIQRIYEMIPSCMENKKKRIIVKNIENTKSHKQYNDYAEEFEYLTNSGIALAVRAISNPSFPLIESENKNLLKLYLSDVGLLTCILYGNNINAVLQDERSVNLGSVYESFIAQEFKAHGYTLHYYDNKQKGEVDYLIDDYTNLTVLPVEIKSGKDYTVHSALDKFIATPDYNIHDAVVLSNERQVYKKNGIKYMPIYYCMFFSNDRDDEESTIIPPIELPIDL